MTSAPDLDPKFEALLDYLQKSRGFDFTAYKRASLMRRVAKRMQTLNIEDFEEYLNYLEVHPNEFDPLFNTILINVTSFFRDREAWDFLAKEVLPQIVEAKEPGAAIRVWSAGCASGAEAYSIAMLLAEALVARHGFEPGLDAFRYRAKIYATDVDEEALQEARHASFAADALRPVPEDLLERYFERGGKRFTFRNDLRRSIIFGRHDLIQDAPISRLDLLICRNTIMYFNAEAQRRILARFHFALNDDGFLFLGKAEMLLTHAHLFVPVELKHRIFAKVFKERLRDRMVILAEAGEPGAVTELGLYVRLREAAFNVAPGAQVVIDRRGNLALANDQAETIFGLAPQDVGRPFSDLELSYRPLELRSLIDRVHREQKPLTVEGVERIVPGGETRYYDVHVLPLRNHEGHLLGTAIDFQDVSRYHFLKEQLERSRQDLETTNEELHSTVEELETTNEELHSTVEELQTSNEELQSTNEEMETMNEELQSTNEELEAINTELRQRSLDLDRSKTFLQSILASVHVGVVVVDRDLKIVLWNDLAEDLWGLRADEVQGQSLLSLDIGLPVQDLAEPLYHFLEQDGEGGLVCLEAINRRGRPVTCEVHYSSLRLDQGNRQGIVLLIEPHERQPEQV